MTTTQDKLRGLFLATLMVLSVFAGTIAFAGSAAAANGATFDTLDPSTVSDGETVTHDYQVTITGVQTGTDADQFEVVLPASASFNTSGTNTVTGVPTDSVSFVDRNGGTNNALVVDVGATQSTSLTLSGKVTVDFPNLNNDDTVSVDANYIDDGGSNVSTSADVDILNVDEVEKADSDDNADSGATQWYGQELYFQDTSASLGDEYTIVLETDESSDNIAPIGTFRVDSNGEALIDTELQLSQNDLPADIAVQNPSGNLVTVNPDGTVDSANTGPNTGIDNAEFAVIKQNVDLSFRDADGNGVSVLKQGDGQVRFESNRGTGYNALITVDDTENVTDSELESAFAAFGAVDRRSGTNGSGVVVSVPNQRVTRNFSSSSISVNETADIDFTVEVTDAVASDTEELTLEETFASTVEKVGADVTSVGSGDQQVGDIVEINIDYNADYSNYDNEETTFQTLVTIGGTSAGFVDVVEVTDEDQDGQASFTVNTYTLGTTAANATNTAGVYSIDTAKTYDVTGDSEADAPDDGDLADGLSATRVDEEFIGSDAFDIAPSLDLPVESDSYTVRTHNESELDDGENPITTSQQQEGDAAVTRLAYPVEDDAGELVLNSRGVGDFRTWIAPSDADLNDLSSVQNAVEDGSLTQSDTVAEDDTLVIEANVEGLGGQIDAVADKTDDARDAFLGYDGIFMVVEQQTKAANVDRFYVDLNGPGVTLIQDQENDTYYFVLETDRIQDARRGDDYEGNINTDAQFDRGEYDVQFVKAGGGWEVGSNYFEEGDFPGPNQVNFNAIFPNYRQDIASDFDPYQDQNEQQLQSTSATVVQRQATFDRVDPDGNLRAVAYDDGTPVSGQTTLAPGSEFVVRLQNESESNGFLVRETVEVGAEQTWSLTADLSDTETPTTFEATVQESGRTIVSDSQAGIEGFVPGVLSGASTVTIDDQETAGNGVTISSVYLPQGGFVTIHDASLLDGATFDSVAGSSQYLPPGTHQNVRVNVDIPQDQVEQTLIAMPHQDTNENQVYEFVSSNGTHDAPYTELDGSTIVVDSANITNVNAATPTPTPTATPTATPTPTPTDEPTPTPTDEPTPTPTDEPTPTPTPGQPGFGFAVAIIALAGAALLALRRE